MRRAAKEEVDDSAVWNDLTDGRTRRDVLVVLKEQWPAAIRSEKHIINMFDRVSFF